MISMDDDGANSSVEAIMGTMKSRKAQLRRQQRSVSEVNDDAERVDVVSLTKRKTD